MPIASASCLTHTDRSKVFDVEKEDMNALEDSDFSPDSMGEDIGEIAEEAGEFAREGAEIITALL